MKNTILYFLIGVMTFVFSSNLMADERAEFDKIFNTEFTKIAAEMSWKVSSYVVDNLSNATKSQLNSVEYYNNLVDRAINKYEPWFFEQTLSLAEQTFKKMGRKPYPRSNELLKMWKKNTIEPVLLIVGKDIKSIRKEVIASLR